MIVVGHLLICTHVMVFADYVLNFTIVVLWDLIVIWSSEGRLSFNDVTVSSVVLIADLVLENRLHKISVVGVHVADLAAVESCSWHLTHGLLDDEVKWLLMIAGMISVSGFFDHLEPSLVINGGHSLLDINFVVLRLHVPVDVLRGAIVIAVNDITSPIIIMVLLGEMSLGGVHVEVTVVIEVA